jgi:chromosomal replication initiation ATPase DnaA
VARITGVAADDLTGPRQGGQVAFARCVAAYVAKRLGRIPVSRMARRFHLDDSSLARPLSALDARLAQDASLRAQIDRIVIEIREPEARRESNDEGRPERKSENQG